jgi:uncharacterized protein DUF4760
MRRIVPILLTTFALLGIALFFLGHQLCFTTTNYVTSFGYLFVISSIILVYFQIRINLRYNKRKSATEFIFNKIQTELVPKLFELKNILGLEHPTFESIEPLTELLKKNIYSEETKKQLKDIIKYILNFYERMAICIHKEVFDDDICYDDTGFILIQFYHFTKSYVTDLQHAVEGRAYVNFMDMANRWELTYTKEKEASQARMGKENRKRTIRNKPI